MQKTENGLTASTLKIIAIVAMTIDHIAWIFVPLNSVLGQIMHIIGRMTILIMSFLIVEGYYHTRNVNKYLLRLGIFALISHVPFLFFETQQITLLKYGNFYTSVIYTLFLGLLALVVAKNQKILLPFRIILIIIILFLSSFGDWAFFPVGWILCFGLLRDRKTYAFLAAGLVSVCVLLLFSVGTSAVSNLFQLGTLLSFPLVWLYNGTAGRKGYKYFFYIYYPVHMIIIVLLKIYVL